MVWHIFKKDWKLLWPIVIGVAIIHFLHRFGWYKMGHFASNPMLHPLLQMMQWAGYLGMAFLIAFVVQQDAVPGVRQDWLVRPIRRRDLLFAKILFVLLLVQGPMIAADTFEGLSTGFTFGQSFAAAFSRGLGLLPFLFLAFLAFAALTQNLMEMITGGVLLFIAGGGAVLLIGTLLFSGRPQFWVEWSGLSWISQTERILVSLVVATVILCLLYFRRKVTTSRWIFASGALLWMLSFFTPWRMAFAVQRWASAVPAAAQSIAIDFLPSLGKGRPPAVPELENAGGRIDDPTTVISLPLRISGLDHDRVLKADHYEVFVVKNDQSRLDAGVGSALEIFNEGRESEARIYQALRISTNLYEHFKDLPVNLEIDYFLTSMRLSGAYGFSPLHDDQRNPTLGWCKTRVNGDQTAVQLRCLMPTSKPSNEASCASAFLENQSTGKRNPERFVCVPNYSPFMESITDSFSRFGFNIPFRDPTGLAQYPVDGSQLANAQAVIRVYQPVEHFSRRLVIPAIRLSDWVAR
ncbi:MAG TPA: hypothetical protein VG498_25565 [Terriglobales bacterium]|nr:hypothetical protein [Terriglobales bacterium]